MREADKREMARLTSELDEARAEVERLRAEVEKLRALPSAEDLEERAHEILDGAGIPTHALDPVSGEEDYRAGLEERLEWTVEEITRARTEAARLRRLIESTAEGLDRITACGEALRQGGPVPEDLDELSDGLHNAVTEAGGLVDEIRAALAGEGEVESLIPVDVDLLGLRLRATHPSPDDVGEAGSYQIMRLRTRRGEPILIDCGAGREIKITVRPSAGGATPEKARQGEGR